jgi:hypothetical protein
VTEVLSPGPTPRGTEGAGDKGIKIELDEATGKSRIKLKPGYKVYFDRANTFRKMLGYTQDVVVDQPVNVSPKMCDVVSTQKIFVEMQGIRGSIFKGNSSEILFAFPNELSFGLLVVLRPTHKQEHKLLVDTLNDLRFKFKDQDGLPINFMATPVSMTLEVRQV